jgi:peroxiredoxin Q/BCP
MPTHLLAGDKAPSFSGPDQNGNKISLSDYKGKKLVVFFYPADDTPVCTVEACNLRDNYGLLRKSGLEVVGISPDDSASHKKIRGKI